MGPRCAMLASAIVLTAVMPAATKTTPEPRLTSIDPFAGQLGHTYRAVVRGTTLEGSHSIGFREKGLHARILHIEPEPAQPDAKSSLVTSSVHIEITIDAGTPPGDHSFSVLTPNGISNEISLHVEADPVISEIDVQGDLGRFPMVVSGRISNRGEIDAYWLKAEAGQTLMFEAISGYAAFDPVLSLYESSGSWFDPQRLNKIAYNDEPLFFPGLSTNARLVHRFAKSGRYCLKVQAFSGQGGPDFVYGLRLSPKVTGPPLLHPRQTGWEERQFTRPLPADWLEQLSRRGGIPGSSKCPETYHAVRAGSGDVPVIAAPGMVVGFLTSPAEEHLIKLKVEQPQSLVIEIETPQATMPRFNPVIRLMEPGGAEIATNVYTKLNNNGLYMMKMIQVKTAAPLRAPGEYTMRIRDITSDRAGDDFAYRVLVRPQIPHIGKMVVSEENVNIEAGAAKPLTVTIEREEDFAGHIALSVSGLPAGITSMNGVLNPVEKPPLPNGGKLERYTPKTQNAALLLVAAPDAPATPWPVSIEVTARPMVNGHLGEPILVKKVPVMVLARRPS